MLLEHAMDRVQSMPSVGVEALRQIRNLVTTAHRAAWSTFVAHLGLIGAGSSLGAHSRCGAETDVRVPPSGDTDGVEVGTLPRAESTGRVARQQNAAVIGPVCD